MVLPRDVVGDPGAYEPNSHIPPCRDDRKWIAPLDFTPITIPHCWRSVPLPCLGNDRHKVELGGTGRPDEGDRTAMARLAPPSEHLLRTQLPAPGHLGHPHTRLEGLGDNSRLLLRGPAPTPPGTCQNLNAPEATLRVVVNVEQNDSSMPSASSHISIVALLSNIGPGVLAKFGAPPVPQPTVTLTDQRADVAALVRPSPRCGAGGFGGPSPESVAAPGLGVGD